MMNVSEFRLSFIWFDGWTDLLVDPKGAPFAELGNVADYSALIEKMIKGQSWGAAPTASLPWKDSRKSFWSLYCGTDVFSGGKCWKHVVPLRIESPVRIAAPWLWGRVGIEVFVYPHGVALVLNVSCQGDFDVPDGMMSAAFDIYANQQYQLTWPDGHSETVDFTVLPQKIIPALRQMALGRQPTDPMRSAAPFSVVTFIQGSGVNPQTAVTDGDDVHKMLDGLTDWSANWRINPPPLLADKVLKTKDPSPGDVLYARRHGRAAWIPASFTDMPAGIPLGKRPKKMGCYSKDLMLASMQVESLATLCRLAERSLNAGEALEGGYYDLCRRAAEVLGRLYGGVDTTYRSRSCTRQIDDNGWVAAINRIRNRAGLQNLKP